MSIGSVFLNFPTDAANTIPYVTDLKSFYGFGKFSVRLLSSQFVTLLYV